MHDSEARVISGIFLGLGEEYGDYKNSREYLELGGLGS